MMILLHTLSTRMDTLFPYTTRCRTGLHPVVVLYVAMMGYYHEIGAMALPSAFLLARLQAPWFEWVFQAAVLQTLVDTGVALLHAINERVAKSHEERSRPMPRALRPPIAVGERKSVV